MMRSFSYFRNTRYLVTTAVLLAVLFIMALPTIFIKIGDSSFQIADGLYMALICVIPGPMMLIDGILWPTFFDLASGGMAYIPMSILVRVLMFAVIKLFKKPLTVYGALAFAGLMLFFYLPYNYGINLSLGKEQATAYMLKEFIVDVIQYGISLMVSVLLVTLFRRPKMRVLFDFSYLKPVSATPTAAKDRVGNYKRPFRRWREGTGYKHHDSQTNQKSTIIIDEEITLTESNIASQDLDSRVEFEEITNTTIFHPSDQPEDLTNDDEKSKK
ncbi:putative energy coupling factor transporter S component [Entomoplasma freundtii]|uniref:Uncharacterized protein n=1 Tax=Entomoplasma freundtii TaxID=74700 RepID=A0A2K8NRJ7_9MOLU|nr:hypothetical protein [Entomoplasma freundtii]ATZ16397.1 hypothetical protein EFREU_v1c03710 [Entomoplasma freundtii]TDY56564.1 putative energy coupling factor transporter S component [Entomoplasma freundtii]